MSAPNEIELCTSCWQHLLYRFANGSGRVYCYHCGNNQAGAFYTLKEPPNAGGESP